VSGAIEGTGPGEKLMDLPFSIVPSSPALWSGLSASHRKPKVVEYR
jgi:hypothetical protein